MENDNTKKEEFTVPGTVEMVVPDNFVSDAYLGRDQDFVEIVAEDNQPTKETRYDDEAVKD